MGRIQPYTLPRLVPQAEKLEITDPNVPGQVLTITLRALEAPAQLRVLDKASRLVAQYIGRPEDGVEPTDVYPDTPQGTVEMSENLIQAACFIEAMQVPDPEVGAPYSFDEIVALSLTMPSALMELMGATGRLQTAFLGKKLKKADPTGAQGQTPSSDS